VSDEKVKITGFPTAKELREAKVTAEARLRREEEVEKVGLVGIVWGVFCGFERDGSALETEGEGATECALDQGKGCPLQWGPGALGRD
jgi:hypothetical protein